MEQYEKRLKQLSEKMINAEYIVIGAGAGLSEAAGFHYDGKRFDENFHEFKEQYHITDMYTGSFYPFESEEEKWAFWAKMIQCNVYDTQPTELYQEILKLVKDKEYFVITTNADHQFKINGFDMNRFFETQGNYIYLQCKKGCHDKVYYNESLVKHMGHQTKDCKIPSPLIPICPVCGGKMDVHVRKDSCFVETEGWHQHNRKYQQFLKKALKKEVLFIEFGVGFNTPGIIRYPFEQMVYRQKNATLIRFNRDYPFCLRGNEKNVISFDEDILQVLLDLELILKEGKKDESKRKRILPDRLFASGEKSDII